MNLKTAVNTCFKKKYFCFQGRADSSEYWFYILFIFMVLMTIATIYAVILTLLSGHYPPLISFLLTGVDVIIRLVLILPGVAVAARRLHDIDRSGWWQLLVFIPIIGSVILIVWFSRKGTEGENRFGPPVVS